jgi:hypothetical protein
MCGNDIGAQGLVADYQQMVRGLYDRRRIHRATQKEMVHVSRSLSEAANRADVAPAGNKSGRAPPVQNIPDAW